MSKEMESEMDKLRAAYGAVRRTHGGQSISVFKIMDVFLGKNFNGSDVAQEIRRQMDIKDGDRDVPLDALNIIHRASLFYEIGWNAKEGGYENKSVLTEPPVVFESENVSMGQRIVYGQGKIEEFEKRQSNPKPGYGWKRVDLKKYFGLE